MTNLYKRLLDLLPTKPLQVGEVTKVYAGMVTVALPGGGSIQALGVASIGARVFVRDGRVEGIAPLLPVVVIQV